jgi:hypothetical protein
LGAYEVTLTWPFKLVEPKLDLMLLGLSGDSGAFLFFEFELL